MEKAEFKTTANNPCPSKNKHKLPIGLVDELAKELADEFGNPNFVAWYCDVIYQLGPTRVHELRARVKDGKLSAPGKLFSKLAKEEINKQRFRELRDAS